MKAHRLIGGFLVLSALLGGFAQAQTSGTRVTLCSAATPNDAICIEWAAVTMAGTTPITGVTYRVEHRIGSTGNWNTVASNITQLRHYAQSLAVGEHYFRVYAACATCTAESLPSNAASKMATRPPLVPDAPVITIAVVIGLDHAPVYSIVSGNKRGGEVIGFVPVGTECTGNVLFRFRGDSYRRVSCADVKTWDVQCRNPAAPCART
jgi:hypothetical protein